MTHWKEIAKEFGYNWGVINTNAAERMAEEIASLRKRLSESEALRIEMREALENLEYVLKRNADGKQPYDGFHTVLEEFQSIWHIAHKALSADFATPNALMDVLKEVEIRWEMIPKWIEVEQLRKVNAEHPLVLLGDALVSLRRVIGEEKR